MKIHQTARKWIALASSLAAFATGSTYATDQALLDALVRKGVLTEKEATAIEQEVSKEAIAPAPGSESKIKLGDWVKELKLYGDLRLRYQYDDSQPQIPKAPLQTNYVNVSQRSRWRFRLRLNADFKLAALNTERLSVEPELTVADLWSAAKMHKLGEAELVGTYEH